MLPVVGVAGAASPNWGAVMPRYEFRLASVMGHIMRTSNHDATNDAAATAAAQAFFDTLLDFASVEVWRLDRRVAILRREDARVAG